MTRSSPLEHSQNQTLSALKVFSKVARSDCLNIQAKHGISVRSSHSMSGYTHSRDVKCGTRTGVCTPRFTAARFTTAKMGKEPQRPPVDGWINKTRSVPTLECHSAPERKGTLTPATTWMDREDILLNEISWKQEDKHCRIPPV